MKETKISWAHGTVNFWMGCNHVSAECEGCYSDTLLKRMGRDFKTLSLTQTWSDAYAINQDAARRGGTAIIFTCSISFITKLIRGGTMPGMSFATAKHVRWLVLSKRPQRIMDHLPEDWGEGYPNVWLGVTVGCRDSYPSPTCRA
jgi:protein gp37